MTLSLDPDIAVALGARAEMMAGVVMPARGDALGLRALIDPGFAVMHSALGDAPDVRSVDHTTTSFDGATVGLRWYSVGDDRPGSAVLYVHGGGMICGTVEHYDVLVRHYVQRTGVPFLSVDYRLAPEFLGTTPVEDAFAGLVWLLDHASELGVDPDRVGIMGDSAGGGVAAGAAILARDRGRHIARQVLIYPMLDDRNLEPDPEIAPFATWTYDNNFTGWSALLGDALGTDAVPPAVAPARLGDLAGLAPAYIEVGELDIFRDEDIRYASRLVVAGVSCELHVHPGAPHGHELFAPDGALSRRCMADRYRVVTSL